MIKKLSTSQLLHRAFPSVSYILKKAFIELTHSCNLNCVHCYIHNEKPQSTNLTLKNYEEIANQLAESSCLNIVLTGGEPLIHPHFEDIYKLFKKKGFLVTVFTNAIGINKNILKLFKEFPPKSIEISLYGVTANTFQAVTRSNLLPETILENTKALCNAGHKVYIKTVLLRQNVNELVLFKQIAKKLKIKYRFDLIAHTNLDHSKSTEAYCIESMEAAEIWRKNKQTKKSKLTNTSNIIAISQTKYFSCGIGKETVIIDPNGNIYPCLIVRIGSYNIANTRIIDAFNRLQIDVKLMKREKIKCDECNSRRSCLWCDGIFYLNEGNKSVIDKYCEITKMSQL